MPERAGARQAASPDPVLMRVGEATMCYVRGSVELVTFLGELALAFGRLLRGQARFRSSDLLALMQEPRDSAA